MRPLSTRGLDQLAAWDGTVVPARDAATVVLLRDRAGMLEAYLMRRQPSMAFAAGMHVFPGGGVQESDFAPGIPWLGPSRSAWSSRLGCDDELAGALVVAGIRETFEETGILLAGPTSDSVVEDTGTPELAAARRLVEDRVMSFGDFLVETGLSLRTDLVGGWTRWITPEHEPRRFDTRFFVALVPVGQRVGELAREADHGRWVSVAEAVSEARSHRIQMMPPTLHTLVGLARLRAPEIIALSATRPVRTIAPRLVEVGGRAYLDVPEAHEF